MDISKPNMRFLIQIFLICLGFCTIAQAQENSEPETLLAKAYELVPNNPEQAIKIGEHLSKNADSSLRNSDADFLIAESHLAKGNYAQALTFAFGAVKFAEAAGSRKKQIRINIFISGILRTLRLEDQAKQYLEKAEQLSSDVNSEIRNLAEGQLLTETALLYLDTNKPQKALELLDLSQYKFKKAKNPEGSFLRSESDFHKGMAFTALDRYDSATVYLDKTNLYFEQQNPENLLGKAMLYNEIARLHFEQKQHQKAISVLFKALKIAEKLQHNALLKDINRQLAINYLALNDRLNYHDYNQRFLKLSSESETLENESTNTAFNLISQQQEAILAAEEKKFKRIFYGVLAIFILVVAFGIQQFLKGKSKQKRYSEILDYLESDKNAVMAAIPMKKESVKNLIIPVETEQNLLAKLRKFETSTRFTSKEMSLAVLSAQLDTNTKYLSEIINKQYQDNFNTYINKLRVNYIIGKLKSDPTYLNYKISYLADESGFSSHSSFATIFKSITGIAPTTFIDFLKEEAAAKNKEI